MSIGLASIFFNFFDFGPLIILKLLLNIKGAVMSDN